MPIVVACVQAHAHSSTRDEAARLHSKLEVVEQRQASAAQLMTEAAHTQTLHAKQLERSIEEHHQQLTKSISKAEMRGQDLAQQIAHRAVSDSQGNMQVIVFSFMYVESIFLRN